MTQSCYSFNPATPGWDGSVYVVRHYGNGVSNVVGYRYLSHTNEVVIASPYADEGYENIIDIHLEKTAQNGATELCVFDIYECFTHRQDALHKLQTIT